MVAGAIVALSLLGSVGVAQASSLTPTQVSAIISLLQAFGADQSVIANVQATLNGQSTTGVVSSVSCSAFSGLKYGDKDTTMSGQVSRLQAFLGISPTTGYYGVLTRTAYGNKCINNNAQPTAVAGMSKYTDADFGFSFWYPSGLEIENRTTNSDGSSFVSNYGSNTKVLRVISAKDNFLIEEVYSPDTSLYYQESPGPFGSDFDHYYFNSQTHTWMDVNDGGPTGKYSGGTQAADISKNTMGGLHMFYGYVRFSSGYVIPLSAQHFLFISRLYGNAS